MTAGHTLERVDYRTLADDWEAVGLCSCGATVTGRCSSKQSARQWLATEHHCHLSQAKGRAPFEVVALLQVSV